MSISLPTRSAAVTSLRSGVTYVLGAWGVLMALTGTLWWLGADHNAGDLAVIIILVLTFAKIYVVGHAFMELHDAAAWLHRLYVCWCIGLCATLCIVYLVV
jgi:hypothetical protein